MPTYTEIANRLLNFEIKEFGVGANDEEIASAEQALGVRIKGSYRKFLKQFGWGGVEHIELYGLGSDVPTHLNLVTITLSEREEMSPRLLKHLVPVMNDGSGNLYCIDTNTTNEPIIVFWDHTGGIDQIPEIEAVDFTSWLYSQLTDLEIG